MKVSTISILSFVANFLWVAYLGFIMFVIGYLLRTENSFGIGRIDPEEGRPLLVGIAQDQGDLGERLAMSILINLRINMAAWFAILFTGVYGLLCVPWQN